MWIQLAQRTLIAMIIFDHVSKRHGEREVLSKVSFEAPDRQVTAFVGPNGAGKSSAMRILLGLDKPGSGEALVAGQRYRDLRYPLRTVGALLDGSGAHRSRTARAHLQWVACATGIPRYRVSEVLDQVGLTAAANKRVGKFSLGMGQRLGIATALLGQPKVLVLDEPTNGLDPEGVRWLRQLLRSHADNGGTVLLSSHQMSEVEMLADHLVVISNGCIVASGVPSAVTQGYDGLEDAFFGLTSRAPGSTTVPTGMRAR